MDLQEVGWRDVVKIALAQDRESTGACECGNEISGSTKGFCGKEGF
jgi:hypothetical protein